MRVTSGTEIVLIPQGRDRRKVSFLLYVPLEECQEEAPEGDVTFVFTDVQSSTPLWENCPEVRAPPPRRARITAPSPRPLTAPTPLPPPPSLSLSCARAGDERGAPAPRQDSAAAAEEVPRLRGED